MANFLSRLGAKLTFWDQSDDRRVDREDEEERRRRNAAAVSSSPAFKPRVNTPSASLTIPTVNSPLQKAGSQNDSANRNPIIGSQSQFAKPVQPQDQRSNTEKELDRLAADNLDSAREEQKKNSNFWEKTFNGKAIEERAVAQARNRATTQYQEKNGWNADPEVIKYGEGTMGRQKVETNRLRKQGEDLNRTAKVVDKVGEVASYVPIAGSVINLGLTANEGLAKARGTDIMGNNQRTATELRTKNDFGMTQDEFDKLDPETQAKLRNLQTLGLALTPLDFAGVGGIAKSGVMSTGKKAIVERVKDGAVDAATKAALKKATKSAAKNAAIPTVVGTGASVGAQAYLGGAENIDLVEAGKTGLMVGGTSMLFPSDGIRKASKSSIKNAAEAGSEAPRINGLQKLEAAEEGVEVADGMKSNNVAKVQNGEGGTTAPTTQNEPIDVPQPEAPTIPTQTPPRVPDVTNPRALAKADETPIPATEFPDQLNGVNPDEAPMADFSKAINAPLRKAEPATEVTPEAVPNLTDIAEDADLRVSTRTDAEGNPAIVSDATAARELEEAGIAPPREASPVETAEEAMADATAQAARDEVNLEGTAAPRTRARITARIGDEELRNDLNTNVPMRERVSLQEAELNAKNFINDLSDEALIGRFAQDVAVTTPEGFYAALNGIRRLETIDAPESRAAIRNALDAMAEYSSESGRGLRTTQIVFEDMPTTMKAEYLINKIQKAGVEMDDASRAELLRRIQISDELADNVRNLEAEATQILESGVINNRSMSPEVEARANQLAGEITEAQRAKALAQGDAWMFYQDSLPKSSLGKRAGEMGRSLMLASVSGRVFDNISTGLTAVDDILNKSVAGGIGKLVNLIKGRGTVEDTGFNTGQYFRGAIEGGRDIIDSAKGNRRVESILEEASRNSRANLNVGNGPLRRAVNTLVEMPTNLTRGMRNNELYSKGMQEAAQLGLKGDAQDTYATLRASIPSEDQLRAAEETWKKTNMLHDNPISRGLNNIANSLDKKGGGWAAPLIRNQIAPFTSWLGGNLHRTLTDKNVAYNAYSAVRNAVRGDLQGVVNDISRFGVNSAQSIALGYMLTEAGLITTEDANGDSYAGLYIHVGDRYIPVAIAGTAAVPIILGNAAHQGMQEGGTFADTVNAAGGNLLKNAGVASVFGGDNNFQNAIDSATKEGGNLLDAAAQYVGGTFRQYIPGLTADVNSVLDQVPSLNETGEAAETKVTNENPETGRQVTDVLATEVNKTLNRIPFASQGLDRKEGVTAKDLLDRSLKSTRETGEARATRERTQSIEEIEKELKKAKVPLTDEAIKASLDDGDFDNALKGLEFKLAKAESNPDSTNSEMNKIRDEIEVAQLNSEGVAVDDDGIKARVESGDYDSALRGYEYQLAKIENDKDTPESSKQKIRDEILRIGVTQGGSYPPSIISLYSDTSQSEWRAMGDPESEDYDPDTYALLEKYDKELTDLGVSKSTKGGSKNKFVPKASGGGRGGKGSSINTSIATQSGMSFNFTPQKAKEANVGLRKSALPTIERVPNNDRSKLKKISVSRGR